MKFKVMLEPDEGGAWNASIPAVRGCHTWGRSLEAARRYIREALASCVDVLGEDAERIARDAEFEERFVLPRELGNVLRAYEKRRTALERGLEAAKALERAAAVGLVVEAHLSLRDAGSLMHLSQEHVRSLVREAGPGRAAPRKAAAPGRAHAAGGRK